MEWLTTVEVGRLLSLSPRRIRQLKDRIGGYETHGGTLVFTRKRVLRFAADRAVKIQERLQKKEKRQ